MTHLLKEGKVSSNITYASQAQNVTVRMCMTPLVKLGIVSSNITYASKAQNVTVRVCLTPLVKVGIDTYSPKYILIKCHILLLRTATYPDHLCVVLNTSVSVGLRMILILWKMMFPSAGLSMKRSVWRRR